MFNKIKSNKQFTIIWCLLFLLYTVAHKKNVNSSYEIQIHTHTHTLHVILSTKTRHKLKANVLNNTLSMLSVTLELSLVQKKSSIYFAVVATPKCCVFFLLYLFSFCSLFYMAIRMYASVCLVR